MRLFPTAMKVRRSCAVWVLFSGTYDRAVFNYWEPTHYLSHGYGLQTWEYSPVYAIRSWAYVGLHAVLSRIFSEVPNLSKVRMSGGGGVDRCWDGKHTEPGITGHRFTSSTV
jgi:hypothetical protein